LGGFNFEKGIEGRESAEGGEEARNTSFVCVAPRLRIGVRRIPVTRSEEEKNLACPDFFYGII
jgi:hypothetical protein